MEAKEKPSGAEITAGLKLCQLGQEVACPSGRALSARVRPGIFLRSSIRPGPVFRETADRIQTNLTELGTGAYFGRWLWSRAARSASVEPWRLPPSSKVFQGGIRPPLGSESATGPAYHSAVASWLVAGTGDWETEVVHQVSCGQVSWFDFVLMLGLSLILSLVVNIYNDNRIPLIHGWGDKNAIPEITLDQGWNVPEESGHFP